jgi:hypothetical protein
MSMLEAEPAAPRRKRKPAASDKACHKRTRHEDTVVSVAEIDKLLTDHEARASNKTVDSSCTSVWMALNVVLDHCTIEKTLLQHDLSSTSENKVVPVVSRAYEESFMRECIGPEDLPCSLGQYCECNFIDEEHAFVGVSFVMPELRSEETSMCILCLRKLTQMLFYRVAHGGHTSDKLLQTYGNLCDVPGEYHSSAMLIMPPHGPVHCMPLPVVSHQRNKYFVELRDGHRYLRQRHVYVEDFT